MKRGMRANMTPGSPPAIVDLNEYVAFVSNRLNIRTVQDEETGGNRRISSENKENVCVRPTPQPDHFQLPAHGQQIVIELIRTNA